MIDYIPSFTRDCMFLGPCFVTVFVIGLAFGRYIGRHLERGDCRRRLREQNGRMTARMLAEAGSAYRRGRIEGYELKASKLAGAQRN